MSRRTLYRVSIVLCFAASITEGCGRQGALQQPEAAAGSPAEEQSLPFHQSPDQVSDDSARPAVPADRKPETARPFREDSHSRTLPAGTLITVKLDGSISVPRVHPGDAFAASVAGPLVLNGETVIEAGTPVSGRVEAIQPAMDRQSLGPDPGYLRLTLNSINLDGHQVILRTSSLFARAASAVPGSAGPTRTGTRTDGLGVLKGRRLTFRLTTPITVTDPRPIANLHYSQASHE